MSKRAFPKTIYNLNKFRIYTLYKFTRKIVHLNFPIHRIDMKTGAMMIGGFGGLRMDYIRVVRHFGLKDIKVSLRFGGDLKILGNYTLKEQQSGSYLSLAMEIFRLQSTGQRFP